MRRIRQHLSFANVVSVIALFVAISGGTAVALKGSNTVQSDDIGPGAQVKAADVVDESLTGADIKNKSGVDSCVAANRIANLCVRAENADRPWSDALAHCANLGFRLPALGEALELARTHNVPNLGDSEFFWTDDRWNNGPQYLAEIVNGTGTPGVTSLENSGVETLCVTNPTN